MNDTSLERRVLERAAAKPRVDQLVAELAEESGTNSDVVVKGIVKLVGEKKLVIAERTPYATFISYALSPISLWFWGAFVAVGLSTGLIAVSSGVGLYLRYVFGGMLVLYLPGYALVEALYPKRDLDELTRFALSIGLSLALVTLVGLVLNYTPFGISLLPVTLSIAGLTTIILLLALTKKFSLYRLSKRV